MTIARTLFGVLVLLGGSTCTPKQGADPAVHIHDLAPIPDLGNILVVLPAAPATQDVLHAIQDELFEEFNVVTLVSSEETSVQELDNALQRTHPRSIALMGNAAVRLYRSYQRQHPKSVFPPCIVVMAALAELTTHGLQNAVSIAYEIPAVTSFALLRSYLRGPMKKVGVIHRKPFAGLVKRERTLMRNENMDIIGVHVPDHPTPQDISQAIEKVVQEGAQALWVLNDNRLLKSDLIVQGWIPTLGEHSLPVVVGVEGLVHSNLQFGSFAVLPEHSGLGLQTAELIFELADEDWTIPSNRLRNPVSVRTVVNRVFLEKELDLTDDQKEKLDKVVD